jgi:DNA polymerase III subunit delta
MLIKPSDIASNWNRKILPIYWLSGDEPLQMLECKDLLLKLAKSSGFTEREVYFSDQNFQWEQLYEASSSMSLFAERKVIDLKLSKLPDKKAQQVLVDFVGNANEDTVLLIESPKIEKRHQSAKWFKTIADQCAVIQVWPLEGQMLMKGLQQRAQALGLQLNSDAAHWLASRVEGNLLAAKQELEKLALLDGFNNSPVTLEVLEDHVADHAKFSVFKLMEVMLNGQTHDISRIIYSLKKAQVNEMSILAMLTREVRLLIQLSELKSSGQLNNQSWPRMGIWGTRKNGYLSTLNRYPSNIWQKMLLRILKLEKSFKGLEPSNFWLDLEWLILFISGKKVF